MKRTPVIFIWVYVLIRLFLLPIEHSGDGWGYACEILKGDLFAPHHILYKPLLWGIWKIVAAVGIYPNPIQFFSAINLIFGGLCLSVFYSILNLLGPSKILNLWLLILVSFTFGFIRYSGENETYIMPLFFSLWGTYFWLKESYWKSIFILCLAVLFHQIHIFWLVALFVPQKKNNIHVQYFLTSCIILIGFYFKYALLFGKTWYLLPFSDVQSGYVDVIPGIMNFIMTPVSFVRTFIQIHGNITVILFDNPVGILSWISLCLILFLVYTNTQEIRFTLNRIPTQFKGLFSDFVRPLGLAFLLHFLFAFYSVGNAEFMVMLPFLFILWQYNRIAVIPLKLTHSLAVILGLWNLAFWIIPGKFMEFEKFPSKLQQIYRYIENHPQENSINVYVGSNHVVFSNFWEYQMLNRCNHKQGNHLLKFLSIEEFELEKDKKDKLYFTDEISHSNGFNRKSLIANDPQKSNQILWKGFKKIGPEIQVLDE